MAMTNPCTSTKAFWRLKVGKVQEEEESGAVGGDSVSDAEQAEDCAKGSRCCSTSETSWQGTAAG